MAAEHIDDPAPYAARYRTIVDQHLLEQQGTYALEQRWPQSPFWSRRHRSEGVRAGGRAGEPPVT